MMSTHTQEYDNRLSAAITWLRFPLIFMIIMLHCYSVVRLEGERVFYFESIYPFALWLGETGVPAFFFISGYLFYLSKKSYKQKLKTRFHTLFIPYLLWNTIILAFYIIAFATGHPQDINHNSIADYTFTDYIRLYWDRGSYDNGNFVPLLCPFWYIRNLLIMSILSPLLFYIIKYLSKFFLLVVTIWWMSLYHNAFIPQTILFFSLGAYFSILNINPLMKVTTNNKWFYSLFILFAMSDIATHSFLSSPWSLQIHRLSLLFNIPAFILIADYCIRKNFLFDFLPHAAFIVFAVHYPIVVVLRKLCASEYASASDCTHILLYFLCIIITTMVSLLTYFALSRYFPKFNYFLSGNR